MSAPGLLTLRENLNPPPTEPASSPVRFYRPTWVEISTHCFASNLRQIKQWVGPNAHVLAVLKADGYGHGALPLAQVAASQGAAMIGVSSLEEGIHLREGGVEIPILILGSIYPLENFNVALQYNLTPTVSSLEAARHLSQIAESKNTVADFHLKIDTGMGRLGVSPLGAKPILEWLMTQKRVRLAGVYSHFASADTDPGFVQEQMNQFHQVRDLVLHHGFQGVLFHMANTAAALRFPQSRFNLVRPGLFLYGASLVPVPKEIQLEPVLSWYTKIVFLKTVPAGTPIGYGSTFRTQRESTIATLPVGYADGLPRGVSNKGWVLVKGRRCPMVGRVTMDQVTVDVTDVKVDIGELVTLIGRQEGETISADDWALWAGTISYEIFCGITKRVPRVMIP
ncbi:MAG: Alanine racemase 1 [Elusimicrobia bacterium]|nr:Alanine racemase 1 [Elusimicrobiota bacterium]